MVFHGVPFSSPGDSPLPSTGARCFIHVCGHKSPMFSDVVPCFLFYSHMIHGSQQWTHPCSSIIIQYIIFSAATLISSIDSIIYVCKSHQIIKVPDSPAGPVSCLNKHVRGTTWHYIWFPAPEKWGEMATTGPGNKRVTRLGSFAHWSIQFDPTKKKQIKYD